MSGYADLYEHSMANPGIFWLEAAEAIDWDVPPDAALDTSGDVARWFLGGRLNTSYNALDRHVEAGDGDRDRKSVV